MINLNEHYSELKSSYLFYNIAQKTKAYLQKNPNTHLLRLGIGDVTLPLCKTVVEALHKAVDDQGNKETFHGYMPECGADFYKKAILSRIDRMAKRVYRGNKNAVYMFINDLEEFFEINDYNSSTSRMTSEEFDRYIEKIKD